MAASYTKLKSGEWGIRVQGETVSEGATVVVKKKDGTTKQETVAKVVWSGGGVSLCAIGGSGSSGGQSAQKRCSSCGCNESALRKPYEKMLTTRNYGVICSPCYNDAKDGYGDD